MHSQAQYGSRSSSYKKTFLKTERDCSWQACRNSSGRLSSMWGICQANKGPALPGTGSLEGGLPGSSFSGDRGTSLFPFPSGCASTEEPGSWLIPIHPGLQAGGGNFHPSCMAKSQPRRSWSICLLLVCTQATKHYWGKSHHQADWFHSNSGSLTPHGPKGGWKFYYISLVSSHSYQQLFQTFSTLLRPLLPSPPPSLFSEVIIFEFLFCVTKCLNLPTVPFLLASHYNWRVFLSTL